MTSIISLNSYAMKTRKQVTYTILILLLTVVSVQFSEGDIIAEWGRIIFGSITVLFLPGYWLTKCFFKNKEIDLLERTALSFTLSIAVVPLLTFYANLIGLPISVISVLVMIAGVIGLSFVYLFLLKKTGHRIQNIPKF